MEKAVYCKGMDRLVTPWNDTRLDVIEPWNVENTLILYQTADLHQIT